MTALSGETAILESDLFLWDDESASVFLLEINVATKLSLFTFFVCLLTIKEHSSFPLNKVCISQKTWLHETRFLLMSLKEISDFSQLIAFLIIVPLTLLLPISPIPIIPPGMYKCHGMSFTEQRGERPFSLFQHFSTRRLDPHIFRRIRKSIFFERATFPRELFFSSLWIWINLD